MFLVCLASRMIEANAVALLALRYQHAIEKPNSEAQLNKIGAIGTLGRPACMSNRLGLLTDES